jgi:hypothetical protein
MQQHAKQDAHGNCEPAGGFGGDGKIHHSGR